MADVKNIDLAEVAAKWCGEAAGLLGFIAQIKGLVELRMADGCLCRSCGGEILEAIRGLDYPPALIVRDGVICPECGYDAHRVEPGMRDRPRCGRCKAVMSPTTVVTMKAI